MIAFKSISQLEKTVESCLITACSEDCKLRIELKCKYNVTKTYTLPFIESDSLMVSFAVKSGLLQPPSPKKTALSSMAPYTNSFIFLSGQL